MLMLNTEAAADWVDDEQVLGHLSCKGGFRQPQLRHMPVTMGSLLLTRALPPYLQSGNLGSLPSEQQPDTPQVPSERRLVQPDTPRAPSEHGRPPPPFRPSGSSAGPSIGSSGGGGSISGGGGKVKKGFLGRLSGWLRAKLLPPSSSSRRGEGSGGSSSSSSNCQSCWWEGKGEEKDCSSRGEAVVAKLIVTTSAPSVGVAGQKAGPPRTAAPCKLGMHSTTQERGTPIIPSPQRLQEGSAAPPSQGPSASVHGYGGVPTIPTTEADGLTLINHARSAQEFLVSPTHSRQIFELQRGPAPEPPLQAAPCGGAAGGGYSVAGGMSFEPAVMQRHMRAQAHAEAEAAAAEACRLMLRTSTLQVGGTALHHCPPPLHPLHEQHQHQRPHHETHQSSFLLMPQPHHHHQGHPPQQQHASSYQSSFLMHKNHSPQQQQQHQGHPPQQQWQQESHQSSFPLIELRQASMTRLVYDPVGKRTKGTADLWGNCLSISPPL